MIRALILPIALLISACSGDPDGPGGSANEPPGVRFVGRVDETDAPNVRFAWSGTGVVVRFRGTSLSARLSGGQQYAVLVDGELRPKLVSSGAASVVAENLEDGTHVVEIYRRTEANQGESTFSGFELGAGTLLAPPAAPNRRIEIVGDSIRCPSITTEFFRAGRIAPGRSRPGNRRRS